MKSPIASILFLVDRQNPKKRDKRKKKKYRGGAGGGGGWGGKIFGIRLKYGF